MLICRGRGPRAKGERAKGPKVPPLAQGRQDRHRTGRIVKGLKVTPAATGHTKDR